MLDATKIIGRAEKIDLPDLNTQGVYARIDTGAQTSAIWVSQVSVQDDRLAVIFFGQESPYYTGEVVYFDEFEHGMVASSNGQAEARYKIRLLIRLGGKKIRARFTLANRSTQVYPVLIGRNVLRGKFVVDVKRGAALRDEEQKRSEALQARITDAKD